MLYDNWQSKLKRKLFLVTVLTNKMVILKFKFLQWVHFTDFMLFCMLISTCSNSWIQTHSPDDMDINKMKYSPCSFPRMKESHWMMIYIQLNKMILWSDCPCTLFQKLSSSLKCGTATHSDAKFVIICPLQSFPF